jgi:hypothetical protein
LDRGGSCWRAGGLRCPPGCASARIKPTGSGCRVGRVKDRLPRHWPLVGTRRRLQLMRSRLRCAPLDQQSRLASRRDSPRRSVRASDSEGMSQWLEARTPPSWDASTASVRPTESRRAPRATSTCAGTVASASASTGAEGRQPGRAGHRRPRNRRSWIGYGPNAGARMQSGRLAIRCQGGSAKRDRHGRPSMTRCPGRLLAAATVLSLAIGAPRQGRGQASQGD